MMELPAEVVELLSRYGVGRRKLTDPFLEDKPPDRLGVYDADEESLCHQLVSVACTSPGCCYAASLPELAAHYELAHRFCCSVCRLTLPSPHLLDLHLQERHDSFFAVQSAKKPSYCCYIEDCPEKFWKAEERFNHGVEKHKLPQDFRPEQKTNKGPQKKKNKRKQQHSMETDSSCKLSDNSAAKDASMSPLECHASSSQMKLPKKISFGHGKNLAFSLRKFTNTSNKESHVDMDVFASELKDSLPQ